MRRPLVATGIGLALLLGMAHPWVPPSAPGRVYLPHAAQRLASPVLPPRPVYQPQTVEGLERVLGHAGALVVPRAGVYKARRPMHLAGGVELRGGRAVTILEQGLRIQEDNVTVTGLTLAGCDADCIEVKGDAQNVMLAWLDLSAAEDGLLDIYGGASVTLRDSILHDNVRGITLGNWQKPLDGRESLTMIRVRFERVRVRTPKAQDADVYARNLTVIDAVEWPVDARGSSVVILDGYEWSGKKVNPPGWRADRGARVEVRGE